MALAGLIDPFGRKINYLRLSVTEKCNYRCFYCMPEEGVSCLSRRQLLNREELQRLVTLFVALGVSNIRLTGGEPLVRKDLPQLAAPLAQLAGLEELSLSTNGHLLAQRAESLYRAGVSRCNISLDSVDSANFHTITKGGDLQRVIAGIKAAKAVGMSPVKLNMVVMRGVNEHEIEAMIDFAATTECQLRFIETMPMGGLGEQLSSRYYSAQKIVARVKGYLGSELIPVKPSRGAGPARCYQIGTTSQQIGVISAMSQHFCEGCNRIRLTAEGALVLCLGQEAAIPLGAMLLAGASDSELQQQIVAAIAAKPYGHDFHDKSRYSVQRMMVKTGG
ncbi:GTP 3',8-cyclase MoaA [Ectothiorhodospiraceae bacterium BW-2]|nr:GTP 3',8-cyclase MoaA [Ectothiorhodospiraceae bacterium BW-2]